MDSALMMNGRKWPGPSAVQAMRISPEQNARVNFMRTVLPTNGETILGSLSCLGKTSANLEAKKKVKDWELEI